MSLREGQCGGEAREGSEYLLNNNSSMTRMERNLRYHGIWPISHNLSGIPGFATQWAFYICSGEQPILSDLVFWFFWGFFALDLCFPKGWHGPINYSLSWLIIGQNQNQLHHDHLMVMISCLCSHATVSVHSSRTNWRLLLLMLLSPALLSE